MKKHLINLLLGITLFTSPALYGIDLSSRIDSLISHTETNAMSDDQKELALAHANYIKTKVLKKLDALKEKLADLKEELEEGSSSEGDEQFSSWRAERINKKIKDVEKKIQNLNDVLLGIELLKAKINGN